MKKTNVHKTTKGYTISTVPPLSQIYPLQLISCTPDYTSNNYNNTQNIEYLCQDTVTKLHHMEN